MLEQRGDVVREVEPPAIIRWRRHTPKSRAVAIALVLSAAAYVGWIELSKERGGAPPFTLPFVVFVLAGQRLVRRWQTEIIRPRPQTQEDRAAYRRLQFISYALTIVFLAPFLLFAWDRADSPWHLWLTVAVVLGSAVMYLGSWLLRGAYERLFDKIARSEGAYGF